MVITDRIVAIAKERNISISALEKAVGLGNGTIGKWRTQSPSCDKLLKVANYLNTNINYLITGQEWELKTENQNTVSTTENTIYQTDGREQELLRNFRLLPDNQKDQLIGRVQLMAEQAAETRKAI